MFHTIMTKLTDWFTNSVWNNSWTSLSLLIKNSFRLKKSDQIIQYLGAVVLDTLKNVKQLTTTWGCQRVKGPVQEEKKTRQKCCSIMSKGRVKHTHTHTHTAACQIKRTGELGGHFKIQHPPGEWVPNKIYFMQNVPKLKTVSLFFWAHETFLE